MEHSINNDRESDNSENINKESKNVERLKQNKTDPQITELKGFIDPSEQLEPDIKETKVPKTANE